MINQFSPTFTNFQTRHQRFHQKNKYFPTFIDNIVLSVFAKEDNGYARISVRSKKGTSANRCAKMYFHGGGHENAAGGRLYMPEDVECIGMAGEYIEKVTHEFMNRENE